MRRLAGRRSLLIAAAVPPFSRRAARNSHAGAILGPGSRRIQIPKSPSRYNHAHASSSDAVHRCRAAAGASSTGRAARARDVAANRARSLRRGPRSELHVEGRARASRRRGHGDADRDDVAALADRAGSRAPAVDALDHRGAAGDAEERRRAAVHQRRQQRPSAAGPSAGLARRGGARNRHRHRRAPAGAEPAGDLHRTIRRASRDRRTTSSPTRGTSSCAPATRSGRRACR